MKRSFIEIDIDNGSKYLDLLSAISKLSGLFSDSDIPYINYRAVENIFCKSFNAHNLSRSDVAYDANYNSIGVGLKTFICKTHGSVEKIAEFNKLSPLLRRLRGIDLALRVASYRNDRILLAQRTYNISDSIYHIVGRRKKELVLFEADYDQIEIDNIKIISTSEKSVKFEDGVNQYSYNISKSTLFRTFEIPTSAYLHDIEILEDPYKVILSFFKDRPIDKRELEAREFVVLPLFSINKKGTRSIFTKSGINQWNAGGRKRNIGEIYIPIKSIVHKSFPHFFPERHVDFNLKLPSGEILKATICQEKGKALMTNPNNALANWLLRRILRLKEGELATIDRLDELGFDSVVIYKVSYTEYEIDITSLSNFQDFQYLYGANIEEEPND
jgi:hypothetical protein